MATVTKPIALDESLNTTELSSRNVADVLAQELSAVATAIGGIAVPSADHVSYDNSVSGLSATNVQNALDEIVSDIPTVNNGTLTIQQNGTSIGSFSANTASNVTANIKTPTADKKTATSEFTTADGGLLSKCVIDLVPVQSGSGDPYPAGGGKNKFDKDAVETNKALNRNTGGITNAQNWCVSDYIKITENTAYTYSDDGTSSANGIVFCYYDGNKGFISGIYDMPKDVRTITTPSSAVYVRFEIHSDALNVLQFELGSTATPYAPYSNVKPISGHTEVDLEVKDGDNVTQHTYQVQIGSTVYGGYDEIVSGSGKSTYGIADFGDLTWYYDSANTRFRGEMPSNYKQPTGASDRYQYLYCSCYKPDDSPVTGSHVNNTIGGFQGTTYVWVNDSAYTDAGQFKTARTGQKIAYLLSTPTDITTTPQQIETLAGQNNLSTPLSGQSIETNGVEYKELFTFADVKEYIDNKIPDAPTTDGTYTLQAVVSGGVPTYSWV